MIICYKNNRAHYSVFDDQMLSIFFVCINILIVMVNINFHIVNIINMHSAFYKFKSPLDYSVQTKKIEYFTYDIDKTLFCNFTADTNESNSTPKDVVISASIKHAKNLILFLRTLRTTGSKCSIVLFLDKQCITNIDKETLEGAMSFGIQIIITPETEASGAQTKNYMGYIIKEFLRENYCEIDRVIYADLFDTLFQEDPFNIYFPTNSLHLVDEGIINEYNGGNLQYIKSTCPSFKLTKKMNKTKTICAGYIGGINKLIIGYYTQVLTLLTLTTGDDQGATNILYLTHSFQKVGIQIANNTHNKVRHSFFMVPDKPFTLLSAYKDSDIKASIIHVYYRGDENFMISVLKVCPRPSKNMLNYLTKGTKPIEYYENIINNQTLLI